MYWEKGTKSPGTGHIKGFLEGNGSCHLPNRVDKGKVLQGMLQICSSSMVLLSQATENYLSVLIWNISMEKMGL